MDRLWIELSQAPGLLSLPVGLLAALLLAIVSRSSSGSHNRIGQDGKRSEGSPSRSIGGHKVGLLLVIVIVGSVVGFFVGEALAIVNRHMDALWTPYAAGDLAFLVGAALFAWQSLRHKGFARSLQTGMLTTGSLCALFLLVTGGLIAANDQAIQLPTGIGAVYRYDPRIEIPAPNIVPTRPETKLVAHLDSNRAFPSTNCSINNGLNGTLQFDSRIELHPVSSYEIESVLIRRAPNERWWDDDPTFVATVHLQLEFADLGPRELDVEFTGGPGRQDPVRLGVPSFLGFTMPELAGWQPGRVRT